VPLSLCPKGRKRDSVRDKSQYSFLIAFSRQLAAALENDYDDDVAVALASLAVSLELLLSDGSSSAGGDDGGPDASGDAIDAPGDGPTLAHLVEAYLATRGDSAAADVDVPRKRTGGLGATTAGRQLLGEREPQPPVLSAPRARHRPARKGARRGKK